MTFELYIGGVDFTDNFVRGSLSITENLQANGSSMTVEVEISHVTLSAPLGGQFIQFLRDGTIEFAGRINTVEETTPVNPHQHAYHLSCVDFTVDLDSRLLQTTLPAQLAGDAVRQIIGLVGRGFTATAVVDGPTISEQRLDLVVPSSVISQIAESIEHQWYVDYERNLNFFYILDRAAPLSLIDLDTDTNTYYDASVDEDWSQVKNVIYLSGASAKSSYPDTIIATGDGDTKFQALGYPPWSLEGTSVEVDAVPQNILLDGIDGFAGDGTTLANTVYLCLDNHGIRWPDNNAPAASSNIEISYDYGYEPVIKVEDPVSIAAMAARENTVDAPSDGIHEFKFDIPDLRVESEEAIWDYGMLLLARYAFPTYTVRFGSRLQGWRAGQNLRIYSDASRRNFDRTCYVKSVTKKILQSSAGQSKFSYQIEASSSPFPG